MLIDDQFYWNSFGLLKMFTHEKEYGLLYVSIFFNDYRGMFLAMLSKLARLVELRSGLVREKARKQLMAKNRIKTDFSRPKPTKSQNRLRF